MNTKIKLFGVGLIALVGFFAGANLVSAQTATVTTCNSATINGTVTDTSGGVSTSAWFEWGTTQSFGNTTPSVTVSTPQNYSQVISGLIENTTYYYRAVVSNIYGTAQGSTLSFTTPLCTAQNNQPSVTTNSASSVSQNSATLNGFVTSTGTNTSAWFEWGTTQSFGNTTPTVSYGTGGTNFNNTIFNLSANTTYYFRAVAQGTQGNVYGSTLSFTTSGQTNNQPTVTTNSASLVTQNSATLNGYVASNAVNTSAWFEWGMTQSFGYTTPSNSYGTNGSNFNYAIFNLAPNTTYYFRAVGQGAQGPVYGSTLSFTTSGQGYNQTYGQPYVSTNSASSVTQNSATLNGYVTASGTNTSAWFEWGTSYSLGNTTPSISYGTGPTSFNSPLFSLSANTTYYFRAVAQSSYGTVYGSTLSFTTSGQTTSYNYNTGVAPTVTTLLATELTGTTARLNGLVFTTASQSSNAWFEWGATSNLGNTTQSTNVGALPTVKHSDFITGLAQGQTYYYRIVAENTYGKVYGSTNTFVSEVGTYVAPVVTTPVVLRPVTTVITRGSSVQALVSLSIEGGAEMITSGEKRTYHVAWKNESAQGLKNVVLRIVFPQSMNVESATKGTFSSADNSVTIDLKTLASKESGETFIFATAGDGLKAGELLVVTANMVYTETNGVQGDAIAYVTHRAETTQSAIGANIFGAGDFLPTTLFGWILLLILILILVFLGNHLYGRFSDTAH